MTSRARNTQVDWDAVRAAYCASGRGEVAQLAQRFGVTAQSIYKRASRGQWRQLGVVIADVPVVQVDAADVHADAHQATADVPVVHSNTHDDADFAQAVLAALHAPDHMNTAASDHNALDTALNNDALHNDAPNNDALSNDALNNATPHSDTPNTAPNNAPKSHDTPNTPPNTVVPNTINATPPDTVHACDDLPDIERGLRIARQCLIVLEQVCPALSEPRDVKVLIEATGAALESLRKWRGLHADVLHAAQSGSHTNAQHTSNTTNSANSTTHPYQPTDPATAADDDARAQHIAQRLEAIIAARATAAATQ